MELSYEKSTRYLSTDNTIAICQNYEKHEIGCWNTVVCPPSHSSSLSAHLPPTPTPRTLWLAITRGFVRTWRLAALGDANTQHQATDLNPRNQ